MSKILGKRRADQLHSAAMRQDTETLRTIIRENGDAYAVLSSLAETCAIENKPDSLRVLCAEEYPMGNALYYAAKYGNVECLDVMYREHPQFASLPKEFYTETFDNPEVNEWIRRAKTRLDTRPLALHIQDTNERWKNHMPEGAYIEYCNIARDIH